jgi:hypothetical protein
MRHPANFLVCDTQNRVARYAQIKRQNESNMVLLSLYQKEIHVPFFEIIP